MTQTELSEILEKHRKWLEAKGGGERADLHEADLRGADLRGAELRYTNLRGADLCEADLCGADLIVADLREADLHGADLCGADLRGADLRGADLRGADLCGADLYRCTLPLWCGGLHIILDRLQMAQLIYHFCSMECEDLEVVELQKSMYAFANEFAESREDLRSKKFPEEVISDEQSTQTM